ncbi:hypothetical protein [Bacteroides fragilis]
MTLFLFSQIFLFIPLCQFDNLPAYFFQLTGFSSKFVEKCKRFLLPVNGVDSLYTLVIVVAYSSELLIESGELGIILLRFLVNLYDLELSTEDTGEDKFGLVLHAGLFKHREEFFIFLTAQPYGVAMYPWISKHFVPRFVSYKHSFLHDINILEGSTWENRRPRKTFRARL